MNWVIYKCNTNKAFKEISRVLKRDGHAMISYQSGTSDFMYIKNTLNKMFNILSTFEMYNEERGLMAEAIYGIKLSRKPQKV